MLFRDIVKKREELELLCDVLEVFKTRNIPLYAINRANISPHRLTKTLSSFVSLELLEKIPNKKIKGNSDYDSRVKFYYQTTPKGVALLKEVWKMYENFGLLKLESLTRNKKR